MKICGQKTRQEPFPCGRDSLLGRRGGSSSTSWRLIRVPLWRGMRSYWMGKACTGLSVCLFWVKRDTAIWLLCRCSVAKSYPTLGNPQASLSITVSRSLLKLMSIEWVMPSNHLILCRPPLLLPSNLSQHQGLFQWVTSGGQSIGASASVLSVNIQSWFSLGLTGLISLQSTGLSGVFSSTTIRKHQFFSTQPSLWSSSHIRTWLLEKNYSFDCVDLCRQSDVSAF